MTAESDSVSGGLVAELADLVVNWRDGGLFDGRDVWEIASDAHDEIERLLTENEYLRQALVEIDTYLAHDPDVWRIVSVCKVGEVLCDALGAEVIGQINASVMAILCPGCLGKISAPTGEIPQHYAGASAEPSTDLEPSSSHPMTGDER